MRLERAYLRSVGFEELKRQPGHFVLFKEEKVFDAEKRRGVWQKKLVAKVVLDKKGNIINQQGAILNGHLSLYRRIERA